MSPVRWYALMTQPKHEKTVAEQLTYKSVETFLPLLAARSQRKDRTVSLQRPIFPGYVFTRMTLDDRFLIYNVPGVVRMLSHCGRPAAIEDEEIHALKTCLVQGRDPEPHPYIEIGCMTRIVSGPLMGLRGTVVRHKNQSRVVISIAMIHQSMSVELDSQMLVTVQ